MRLKFSWVGWIDLPMIASAVFAIERFHAKDFTSCAIAMVAVAVLILAREVHDAQSKAA